MANNRHTAETRASAKRLREKQKLTFPAIDQRLNLSPGTASGWSVYYGWLKVAATRSSFITRYPNETKLEAKRLREKDRLTYAAIDQRLNLKPGTAGLWSAQHGWVKVGQLSRYSSETKLEAKRLREEERLTYAAIDQKLNLKPGTAGLWSRRYRWVQLGIRLRESQVEHQA